MRLSTVTICTLAALSTAACLSTVPEQGCVSDGGCLPDGGAGGGSGVGGGSVGGGTGGGTGTGGGMGGTGGGTAGGAGGGSAGGVGGGGFKDAGVCGCTNALGCQPGDSPVACGSAMGACVVCGFGEQCTNGTCAPGTCGPSNCGSGCCTNNFCVTGVQQSRLACGTGGGACATCPMGQSCVSGACATSVCDATTCPAGCCLQGQCITMSSQFTCGKGGVTCQAAASSDLPANQCAGYVSVGAGISQLGCWSKAR